MKDAQEYRRSRDHLFRLAKEIGISFG